VTSSVPTISPAGRRLPRTWDPRLHGWTCIGSLNRSTPCCLIAASRGLISVGAAWVEGQAQKLVDRLSTKAKVEGGKSVTSSAQPPPTS
jgi:hypothetical protein